MRRPTTGALAGFVVLALLASGCIEAVTPVPVQTSAVAGHAAPAVPQASASFLQRLRTSMGMNPPGQQYRDDGWLDVEEVTDRVRPAVVQITSQDLGPS